MKSKIIVAIIGGAAIIIAAAIAHFTTEGKGSGDKSNNINVGDVKTGDNSINIIGNKNNVKR